MSEFTLENDLARDEELVELERDEIVDNDFSEEIVGAEVADDELLLGTEPVAFTELGLPEELVKKLAENGVQTAFPIQAATIPDALAGRHVLGKARTGSGKTLAFGLAALANLKGKRARKGKPLALVLVPTRELAMQVSDALQPYGYAVGADIAAVYGGAPMYKQVFALRRGVEVLVATPGRLTDLIEQEECDLSEVAIAILDEADQMADMGFMPTVTELLSQTDPAGQRLLFSATLDGAVDELVRQYMTDPVLHSVTPDDDEPARMDHHLLIVEPADKSLVTAEIAARHTPGGADGKRTILFARTKLGADRIAEKIREQGVSALALHGGMTQRARTKTLADFKDGRVPVLVATDVAARGIHVDGIDLVLHVDPAGDPKDYLHRAGRTARAGESGTVVTLVLPKQRKSTLRLLEQAGVEAETTKVAPSSEELRALTGGRPVAEYVAEADAYHAARRAAREARMGEDGRGGRDGRDSRDGFRRDGFRGDRDRGGFGDRDGGHGRRFDRDRDRDRGFGDRERGGFGGERRSFGERDRGFGGGDRSRNFGDRDSRDRFGGERSQGRDFGGDRNRGFGDRDGSQNRFGGDRNQGRDGGDRNRSFGDRNGSQNRDGNRSFGDRDGSQNRFGGERGQGRDFGGDRNRSFGDRDGSQNRFGGERGHGGDRSRNFGERSQGRDFGGDRNRSFGDRDSSQNRDGNRGFGGDRRSFGDRDRGQGRDFGGDRNRSFGDRNRGGSQNREFGGQNRDRGYGDRSQSRDGNRSFGNDRRGYGDRNPSQDRNRGGNDRRSYGDSPNRGGFNRNRPGDRTDTPNRDRTERTAFGRPRGGYNNDSRPPRDRRW